MRTRERWAFLAAAVLLVVVLPALNALPPASPLRVSNFTLNLFGKFLTYAILALGIDLIWGYTGVLSLGHGVFFGLGAYAMGMHLMLEIGAKGVYQNVLPDFMVWNRVTELPLFWKPFGSAVFTLVAVVVVPGIVALVFGFLTFRSRIRGVYFSIITQALALCAWLTFNRNAMNLGGTNGLSGFKTMFGFPLNEPATQRGLYVVTALCLCGAYLLCRWIVRTPAGKVLVAIRDSETRVLFCGYSPAAFKLFVFTVSACLAGVAGALYVGQVGIITPARIGVLPSIEMIIWVAVGGRGTLIGPIVGAFGVIRPCHETGLRPSDGPSAYRLRLRGQARGGGPLTVTASPGGSIIYLEDVTVDYDGFKALNGLNFFMDYKELRVVIGPNGAGKTTLLDVISGKVQPSVGRVIFGRHTDLVGRRENEIASLGVGRKFQTPSIFANLTVRENLELALARASKGVLATLQARFSGEQRERIENTLETTGLTQHADERAGGLSHGEKQWLEIGMVMVQDAELLLVDEPVAGMTDEETEKTGRLLQGIAQERAVLVIEHDMEFVRSIARTVTVLHEGSVLCEGPVDQVQNDDRVMEVYLGRSGDADA